MSKNIIGELKVNGKIIDGNSLTSVNSVDDIPNDELGLYRFTEQVDGVTKSSHIYENVREYHDAEGKEFYRTTTTNGTQLNSSTAFMSHFDSSLSDFISISSLTNVYCFYYNNDIISRNGVRIGTKKTGRLTLTCTKDGSITFGKYFSYNGLTQVVTYDNNCAIIVDGTKYEFTGSDEDTITINITSGEHTITSNGQDIEGGSTNGRIVLISFGFEVEPYSIYTKHALARIEEVQEVDTKLQKHRTEIDDRFTENEINISKNANDIVDVNNRMGDIQFFQIVHRLPYPSQRYLNKVFRFNNKFYQCIQKGNGVLKEITFDNVIGTSEVTLSNVNGFIEDLNKEDFSTYYYLGINGEWLKLFRNNGDIRLGSSSSKGHITFYLQDNYISNLPCTKLKIGFKAYNQKGSSIAIDLGSNTDSEMSTYSYIDSADTETLIDLTETISMFASMNEVLSYMTINSNDYHVINGETIPNDKRVIITRLIAQFGTIEYEWKEMGGASTEIVDLTNLQHAS